MAAPNNPDYCWVAASDLTVMDSDNFDHSVATSSTPDTEASYHFVATSPAPGTPDSDRPDLSPPPSTLGTLRHRLAHQGSAFDHKLAMGSATLQCYTNGQGVQLVALEGLWLVCLGVVRIRNGRTAGSAAFLMIMSSIQD